MDFGDLKVGDLVWAKMKGYSSWPAKISEPSSDVHPPKHKKAHFVNFFGTNDFAWILDENICLHNESILNNLSKKRSAGLQNAIDALINFSKTKKKDKQVSPKKEVSDSSAKSPQTKTVKVIKSITKKHERKVLSSKSVKKTVKRRSFESINEGTSTYPKSRKFETIVHPLSGSISSYVKDTDVIPSWENSSMYISEFDLGMPNSLLARKHVSPSRKKIGFIGLGNIGRAIVKNLLQSGHDVTVWNRTTYKCDAFLKFDAKRASSPAELIIACDITFCSVSDPEASKSLIFGDRGILKGLEQSEKLGLGPKGYVEMTSVDPETSQEIAEAVVMKCGKYLEAPVCGTSKNAGEGTLLILAAGDRKLFLECETCFHAIGKHAYYISCDVGFGSKMNLLLSMVSGTLYAAVAEAVVLAQRLGLEESQFMKMLHAGPLQCDSLIEIVERMMEKKFKPVVTPLKHMQKDLNLSLMMGNQFSQPMPVTAAANEVYKHSRLLKYSEWDVSAVSQGVRH